MRTINRCTFAALGRVTFRSGHTGSNTLMSRTAYTLTDFDAQLEAGPFAWPGGYPLYFLTRDGGVLSFAAAQAMAVEIREAMGEPGSNAQWEVTACDVNWEDESLTCDHTGERIESAYGEAT